MPFFNSFHLDVPNASLRRGKQAIFLTPKALRVLQYLVEHAGQLVTKDDLFLAVWPGIAVTDATLAVCLSQIRKALGDDSKKPRYIETVHRLGYRFIAQVSDQPAGSERSRVVKQTSPPVSSDTGTIIVGRQAEDARVRSWYAEMLAGRRQVLFVAGEAGIGKTTFVRSFLESIDNQDGTRIGGGQCIEQYGSGEPYMPVLEALTRVASDDDRLVELLKKLAPSWAVQLPALLSPDDRKQLLSETQGVTQRRMLREMAAALEALTAESPLVLVLEDLHWSDFSTLGLISAIARRSEPARLMIIGTYRSVEMLADEHPLRTLKAELELHRQCNELRLTLLSEEDIAEYLARRFVNGQSSLSPDRVAPLIQARTEGNPLFMVKVVDFLVEQGSLPDPVKIDAPHSIQQMIEHNLHRLHPEEQRALEAASVAGSEFSAAVVAAALERPLREVEDSFMRLARHEQFVDAAGVATWPDGTVVSRFRLHHSLYADVLYGRIPAGHLAGLHRLIAEWEEAAYGDEAPEIAVELAYHYGLCRDQTKTLKYHELAAERAAARRAYREADKHYRDAIALLQAQPESPERDRREMSLQTALGNVIAAAGRFAETADAFGRARSLAERTAGADSFQIFYGLSLAALARGEIEAAVAIGKEMLKTALCSGSQPALFLAHTAHGNACHFRGDLISARAHFSEARRNYREADFRALPNHRALNGLDFRPATEWHLGYPDRCLQYAQEQLALATQREETPSDSFDYWAIAFAHRLRSDWPRMLQASEHCLKLSTVWQSHIAIATAKIYIAYARTKMGDADGMVDQIRQGLDEMAAAQMYVARGRTLGWLAEVQLLRGDIAGAILSVEQGLEFSEEELLARPELLRLSGVLHLRNSSIGQSRFELAEQSFHEAIQVARRMSAKSDELRAAIELAKLLRAVSRQNEARIMLAEIYHWFTEGFDTADLKEARLLLHDLQR